MSVHPSVSVSALAESRALGTATVAGVLTVHLDDSRALALRVRDLLAALVDLAEHRNVLEDDEGVLLDLLQPAGSDAAEPGSGALLLQVRLHPDGWEVGTRRTTVNELRTDLETAWNRVYAFADAAGDDDLTLELSFPSEDHYWVAGVPLRS